MTFLPRLLVVALIGAVLGYVAETIHKSAGVWVLPDDAGLPVWISVVYFFGIIGAGFAFVWFERRQKVFTPFSTSTLMVEGGLFAALYLAPPLLHNHEVVLTIVASAYLLVRLGFFREKGDIAVAVFAMAADFVLEFALAAAAPFDYSNAQWMPLPLWLAPLWGGLGLGLRRFFVATLRLYPGRGGQ